MDLTRVAVLAIALVLLATGVYVLLYRIAIRVAQMIRADTLRMQYEYQIIEFDPAHAGDAIRTLNQNGNEGWRVVDVDGGWMFLMREKRVVEGR